MGKQKTSLISEKNYPPLGGDFGSEIKPM